MATANDHTALATVGSKGGNYGTLQAHFSRKDAHQKGLVKWYQYCTEVHSFHWNSQLESKCLTEPLLVSFFLFDLRGTSGNKNAHCSGWHLPATQKAFHCPMSPCKAKALTWTVETIKNHVIQNCFLNKIYDNFFFKANFSLQLLQNSFDNKITLFYIPHNSFSWLKLHSSL